MTPVLALTTVDAGFDPRPLAAELVELRLAACVNIVPGLYSVYRWRETIEREDEQLLLIKTAMELLEELKRALFARHPYDVPEFIVIRPEQLSDAYCEWLVSSL